MSSDFERRLRDARGTLPEPDAEATAEARSRALRAVRRRRPRARVALLAVVAIATALAVGGGIGTLYSPGVTAARGPVGLGFLPEQGWYVLQSSARELSPDATVAIASNVQFARDDDVRGLAESSALPYATLLTLPSHGVVLVATFVPGVGPYRDGQFVHQKLPLRLGEAAAISSYGSLIRPDEPLGVYQLFAEVKGFDVTVTIYFGRATPSSAQRRAAQRQLAALIVDPAKPRAEPARTAAPAAAPATVVDRTVVCTTQVNGGIHEIEARAHTGVRESGTRWKTLPLAVVATGSTGSAATQFDDSLAWITAGTPSRTTILEEAPFPLTTLSTGTVAINVRLCRTTSARVPLSSKGLRGGQAGRLGETLDCATPRRVLVRVRVRLTSGGLRQSSGFLRSTAPVSEGSLAVRTQSGKPLVYATVAPSGRTDLYTAPTCLPD